MRTKVLENLKTSDHQGIKGDLKIAVQLGGWSVVLFHESPGSVRQLINIVGSLERIVIVLSFSWFVDQQKCAEIREYVMALCREHPDQINLLKVNVIFAMNSMVETKYLKLMLPEFHVIHVNNACFLSELHFNIRPQVRRFDAVLNSKPLVFKRSGLSKLVENLLFISYGVEAARSSTEFFDPLNMRNAEQHFDVSEEDMPVLLNQAYCGLILSEVEGACYASAEYLLCGLPVVSTPSRGGRDDFYSDDTARIVEPNEIAVRDAVAKLKYSLINMSTSRNTIRDSTVKKMHCFRNVLSSAIAKAISFDNTVELSTILREKIHQSNKLWAYKNFWVTSIETE